MTTTSHPLTTPTRRHFELHADLMDRETKRVIHTYDLTEYTETMIDHWWNDLIRRIDFELHYLRQDLYTLKETARRNYWCARA